MKKDLIVFVVMSVALFSTPLLARLLEKFGWTQKTAESEQDKESERKQSSSPSSAKQGKRLNQHSS